MRVATSITAAEILLIGGVFTYAMGGVRLQLDTLADMLFVDVEVVHDRSALGVIENLAGNLGFVMMPEWECPAEELPNGVTRHWLAEKEVIDDRSLIQAV